MPASSKSENSPSTVNYVETMYKQLRRNETQLKQKLASNLKAQAYLRNIINLERRANASIVSARYNAHPLKRAVHLHSATPTATTTLSSTTVNKSAKSFFGNGQQASNLPNTFVKEPGTRGPQLNFPHRMNLTTPVKFDHFDVTVHKPLSNDQDGGMSLSLNVKNKSSTDVRFCVTFTNAQGKSICVWPIVSETFKDLCDFELLEAKKDVDIELSTRQIPEEYLKLDGERPLTLSIILTSHTIMASTITEVVQLQRQYHSLLRQQSYNGDGYQSNSFGRTAIIRLQGLQLQSQAEQTKSTACF